MNEHQKFQSDFYNEKAKALSRSERLVAGLVFWIYGNSALFRKIVYRAWIAFLIIPLSIWLFWRNSIGLSLSGFGSSGSVAFFISLAWATLYGMNRRFLEAWTRYGFPPFVVTPGEEATADRNEERARRNLYIFSSASLLYFFAGAEFTAMPLIGGVFDKLGGTAASIGLLTLIFFFYYQFMAAKMHQLQLSGGLVASLPKYLEPSTPREKLQNTLDGQAPMTLAACAVAAIITRLVY